jgi:hypothetical protein
MARAPSGVSIGVSGDAHWVHGAPIGHVPSGVGSRHVVTSQHAAWVVQQSCPGAQHEAPQQNEPGPQLPASCSHGGEAHTPLSQYGRGPGQTRPQPPQLKMSLASLTQRPAQQLNRQSHWESVVQLPPVPEEVVLVELLVVELLVVVVPVVVEVPPCPPMPAT